MKYWEVIRVGAKTSAPTQPVMAIDPYKETKETIEDLCDQVQSMISQLKNNKATPMSTDTTLDDDDLRTVISTVCEYHDKYFPTIEMKSTLDPAFMYNIPKNIFNASRMMRAREYPDVVDPLFWFFIFMVADVDQETMSKILMSAADLMISDGTREFITVNSESYDEYFKDLTDDEPDDGTTEAITEAIDRSAERDDDEIADGEIVEEVEDINLGSEAEHVEAVIVEPPADCKHFEYDAEEDDTHVVSLNIDDEDEDLEPTESEEGESFIGMLVDKMEER